MAEDRYTIEGVLGRGHFGVVYLARHMGLDRLVALKVLPTGGSPDDVLQEARKLAQLPEHVNVVEVVDAGVWDDEHVFIASVICSSGSIAARCTSPVDPAAACQLVSDVCRGLEHLHQHGLLHLDIRPANILLEGESPRLVDFGLAKWTHDAEVDDWYGPHAAPELVESGRAAPTTDIYSVAMTLAHLLTGGSICRPFPVNTALVQASADGDWPRLGELPPNVPSRLRKLIKQATQYDYESRPQTVTEFKRLLDKATPAVSFLAPDAIGTLVSTDGVWSIAVDQKPGKVDVVVRRNGRRQQALGACGLTTVKAARHIEKLVDRLAYPAKP